jgi:hypothetical protein
MVLHEWYSGNMRKGSTTTDPEKNTNFYLGAGARPAAAAAAKPE